VSAVPPGAVTSTGRLVAGMAAAAAIVAAVDVPLAISGPRPWPVLGPLDESAHVATAALLLGGGVVLAPPRFLVGVVLGAVAIDVDHLLLLVGSDAITAGTPRPYSHSLPLVLGALALAAPPTRARLVFLGIAAGLVAHLLRDMVTGGLPLLWPLSGISVVVPYEAYAAALGAGALGALLAAATRSRRRSASGAAIAK